MYLTPHQCELVQSNLKLAWEAAFRYHSTCPSIPIDDLFQIASIGLCKAAVAYDPSKGAFSTIAFVMMQGELNMFLRTYRKRQLREAAMPDFDLDRPPAIFTDPTDIFADLEEAELKRWLRRALDRLPADQRTVVYLKLDGQTQRSIGRLLKRSQTWTSRKFKEAITTIRQLAVAEGYAPPELLYRDDTERPE